VEGLKVALFIIGDALFPTDEEDSDPLKGQRSHRDMMSFTSGQLRLIEALSPGTVGDRASGELVKRLAQEFGTSLAEVDGGLLVGLLTARPSYRSNTAQAGDFLGKLESAAIAAKSRKESRSQSGPGPRQIPEQATIGMRVKELGDLFFVPGNIR
jgi:hypothetical protein